MFVLIEALKLINIKFSTAIKDINHTGQNNTHTYTQTKKYILARHKKNNFKKPLIITSFVKKVFVLTTSV